MVFPTHIVDFLTDQNRSTRTGGIPKVMNRVLDFAIEIIAGDAAAKRLGDWLSKTTEKSHIKERHSEFKNRQRLRWYLFMASVGTINRWDPKATYSHAREALLEIFVTHLQDHLDLTPLLMVALQEACVTPANDIEELRRLLRSAKEKALDNWAELERRMAGLALCVPQHPSPDPFFKLMTEIHDNPCHQLRMGVPHEGPQMRLARMIRLAARCAAWLRNGHVVGMLQRCLQWRDQRTTASFYHINVR